MKDNINKRKIIIDANGAVFGRICSFAAKKALEGNNIVIVNSEKSIISGRKEDIIRKYQTLRQKGGHSRKGPKNSKIAYKMLKRGVKGMLPDFRWGIGKQALDRVICYNGVPKEYEEVKKIKSGKTISGKYLELNELVKHL